MASVVPCVSKNRYRSLAFAEQVIAVRKAEEKATTGADLYLRAYWCSICQGAHLTSQRPHGEPEPIPRPATQPSPVAGPFAVKTRVTRKVVQLLHTQHGLTLTREPEWTASAPWAPGLKGVGDSETAAIRRLIQVAWPNVPQFLLNLLGAP